MGLPCPAMKWCLIHKGWSVKQAQLGCLPLEALPGMHKWVAPFVSPDQHRDYDSSLPFLYQLISSFSSVEIGWRAEFLPGDHPLSEFEFDVIIGADGRRNTLEGEDSYGWNMEP